MIGCCICQRGMRHGVLLWRVNAKGEPGVWACHDHLKSFPKAVARLTSNQRGDE